MPSHYQDHDGSLMNFLTQYHQGNVQAFSSLMLNLKKSKEQYKYWLGGYKSLLYLWDFTWKMDLVFQKKTSTGIYIGYKKTTLWQENNIRELILPCKQMQTL